MPQWFRLDRPVGVAYLALGLAGCAKAQPVLAPAGMALAEPAQVAQWVARTTPTRGVMHRFTWLYVDEQASKGGRGSVRIAPPDSLRFDFAGSLGIGKGTAAVVRDSAIWVVPERSVEELVPGIALLWAVLGVAETPPDGARLLGLESEGKVAWQYVTADDTVTYVRSGSDPVTLAAEVRRGGKVVGRTSMTMKADGTPIKARLSVPSVPSKLEITFYATVPTAAFPPDIWARPVEP